MKVIFSNESTMMSVLKGEKVSKNSIANMNAIAIADNNNKITLELLHSLHLKSMHFDWRVRTSDSDRLKIHIVIIFHENVTKWNYNRLNIEMFILLQAFFFIVYFDIFLFGRSFAFCRSKSIDSFSKHSNQNIKRRFINYSSAAFSSFQPFFYWLDWSKSKCNHYYCTQKSFTCAVFRTCYTSIVTVAFVARNNDLTNYWIKSILLYKSFEHLIPPDHQCHCNAWNHKLTL